MQIHLDHLTSNRTAVHALRFCLGTALLLAVMAVVGRYAASAQTPEESYAGAAPGPVGVTNGRLDTQIVDVQLEERADHTEASVQCVFQVQNTDKTSAHPITLTFPAILPDGFTFDPAVLSKLTVDVSGKPQTLTPVQAASPITPTKSVTKGYSLVLTVPPDSMVPVGLRYRQDLGTGPLITFHFADSVGSRWPGPLSSSRITVKFPEQTSLEQMITVRPSDASFDGQSVTWYDTNFEPQDAELVFVAPALWREVNAARLAVTGAPTSAEAHYQLASLYRRVVPGAAVTSTLQSPFYGLMVAELEAARQAARPEDGVLQCRVHGELASLDRGRAYRPDGSVDELYLSQWIREAEGTLESCPAEEQVPVKDIMAGYLQLARLSRAAGHFETAIQQLDAAERAGANATGQSSQQSELTDERRLCYLYWVRDLFRQGDMVGAFQMAEKGLRPDDVQPIVDLIPHFAAVQVAITTGVGERKILLTLTPNAASNKDSTAELKQAIEAAGLPGIKVTGQPEATVLEATLSFAGADELQRQEQALAQALPDWPELAFARAMLSPAEIEFETDETWYNVRARYRETVDTSRAEAALQEQLSSAGQQHAQAQTAPPDPLMNSEEAQAVSAVQQQAFGAVQDAWQTLLAGSQGTFDMSWTPGTGSTIRRVWSVSPGQVQQMRLDSQAFKWRSIATVGALALLGVLIVVLVLFLVARRSRTKRRLGSPRQDLMEAVGFRGVLVAEGSDDGQVDLFGREDSLGHGPHLLRSHRVHLGDDLLDAHDLVLEKLLLAVPCSDGEGILHSQQQASLCEFPSAVQLVLRHQFLLRALPLVENGLDCLVDTLRVHPGIGADDAGLVQSLYVRFDAVRQSPLLANLLEQARAHAFAEHGVEQAQNEAFRIVPGQTGDGHTQVALLGRAVQGADAGCVLIRVDRDVTLPGAALPIAEVVLEAFEDIGHCHVAATESTVLLGP